MQAVTVTGTCNATELGPTLPFEHIYFSLRARHRSPADLEEAQLRDTDITLANLAAVREKSLVCLGNLESPKDEAACAAEIGRFTAAIAERGGTVVSATVTGSGGPRAAELAALSRRTGVRVIMAVGWDSADELPAPSEEEPDASVEGLVLALADGISTAGGERVRAGALGCLVLRNAPEDARLLAALAGAHVRSGAPLLCELPATGVASAEAAASAASAALASLASLKALGVHLPRVLVSHAQNLLLCPDGLRALLREGARLCFTGLGMGWCAAGARPADAPWLLPPSDETVAAALVGLCREGFAPQLLVSPGVESRLQLAAYGGGGYAQLHRSVLPRARRLGLAPEDEARLTAANAAELFCFWAPPPPPERLVKQWSCDACHRGFVEPINEAEALPEDQPYYEKFAFRYCTTKCLSAHRKAEFVQPFAVPPPV